jgi:hypothetical protein
MNWGACHRPKPRKSPAFPAPHLSTPFAPIASRRFKSCPGTWQVSCCCETLDRQRLSPDPARQDQPPGSVGRLAPVFFDPSCRLACPNRADPASPSQFTFFRWRPFFIFSSSSSSHPHRHLAGQSARRAAEPYLFKPIVQAPRALGDPRASAVQISSHPHRRSQSDATTPPPLSNSR